MNYVSDNFIEVLWLILIIGGIIGAIGFFLLIITGNNAVEEDEKGSSKLNKIAVIMSVAGSIGFAISAIIGLLLLGSIIALLIMFAGIN